MMVQMMMITLLTLGGLPVVRRDLGDCVELKTQLACEHTHDDDEEEEEYDDEEEEDDEDDDEKVMKTLTMWRH